MGDSARVLKLSRSGVTSRVLLTLSLSLSLSLSGVGFRFIDFRACSRKMSGKNGKKIRSSKKR